GAHAVKNIARPVETFALSADAIAAIPADALARPAQRAPRRLVLAGAALALLIAAGGGAAYWDQARRPSRTLQTRPAATLDRLLPELPSKARERAVADYLAGARVRAFALAPKAQSRRWTADWPSRDSAIEKVLEKCQISFNEPCALLAVDEELIAPGRDG